jgi:hypothetical protein
MKKRCYTPHQPKQPPRGWQIQSSGTKASRIGKANLCPSAYWWSWRSSCASAARPSPSRFTPPIPRQAARTCRFPRVQVSSSAAAYGSTRPSYLISPMRLSLWTSPSLLLGIGAHARVQNRSFHKGPLIPDRRQGGESSAGIIQVIQKSMYRLPSEGHALPQGRSKGISGADRKQEQRPSRITRMRRLEYRALHEPR